MVQQAARIYLDPANHVQVTLMPEKRSLVRDLLRWVTLHVRE